jgi:hypothetical protein
VWYLKKAITSVSNTKELRYSFGDVNGVMKDGLNVSIGFDENDRCNIEFSYRDQRDGELYCVHATGRRRKVLEDNIRTKEKS